MTIGAFGFTCVFAIFAGLYMRTHNFLAPSMNASLQWYRQASFDTAEIKKIILFKELGLIPEGFTFSKEAKQVNSALLMADEKGLYLCEAVNENTSLEEIILAYNNSGGAYKRLANQLRETIKDPGILKNTLLIIKASICEK